MITRYRLRFRNGDTSAWDTDYNRMVAMAKYFNAKIEKWEIIL